MLTLGRLAKPRFLAFRRERLPLRAEVSEAICKTSAGFELHSLMPCNREINSDAAHEGGSLMAYMAVA